MVEWYRKQRIGDLPGRAAQLWGEREALVFEGRRWSFREFDQEVDTVAKALTVLGVAPGEKVALWLPNRPEWLFLLYAVAKIGAVLVPLNTRYRTADLGYALAQSNSTTLISVDRSGPVDYLGMLTEALPGLATQDRTQLAVEGFPDLKRVIMLGDTDVAGAWRWNDVLELAEQVADPELDRRAAAVDPDGLAMIVYTSGTTGNPKGVMHSHICLRNVSDRANRLGVTHLDRILCYLPLFHIYGLSESAMIAAMTGAAQILTASFDPAESLALAASERITILHGFDTHYRDLMNAAKGRGVSLPALRFGTFPSGMDSSIPIARAAQSRLCPTLSGWGMSECWAFFSIGFHTDSEEQRCEASGFALPDLELKVIDPATGQDQPVGVPGELLVRGYMVTAGYYENPQATAAAIDGQGWLHTGDTVLMRADGHIRFMGRYKDMLKVGGENVAPAEVEAWIMKLPAVAEVAVVGLPDARLAEVPVAVVRVHPGASVTEEQVIAHCRGRIASFKVPRHVLLLDDLPMTASGKVQKHKLRDLALARFGQTKVA
jgi:fatty-acyl-CoA synthase